MGIAWRDAMSTGVAALDNDHKLLVNLFNAVENSLSGAAVVSIGKLLEQLISYCESHFVREEKVMGALNFPELADHVKMHQEILAKAKTFDAKYRAATTDDERKKIGVAVGNLMQDILVNHVLKEDLKIKPLVPARPEPAPAPKAAAPQQQSWNDPPPTAAPKMAPVAQQSWGDTPKPAAKPAAAAAAPKAAPATIQTMENLPSRNADAPKRDRNKDIEYNVPPELEHLLKRSEYSVVELPTPQATFESFEQLCEAAINRRIGKVLIFFQRSNPAIDRVLPQFFLSSPEFAEKFHAAVAKFIFPTIWASRQLKVMSTSFEWATCDADLFWEHVSKQLQQVILEGWKAGWDELKLVSEKKPDGTKVMKVKQETKDLREMLAPSTPESYDMPKVANREIETFKSLLDPATDWWDVLNRAWQTCQDLYEQEKDPRVYQQKAREGAFRDNLLAAFNRYPEEWVDFLLLACHRTFPRITTSFLESFTRNLGRNEAEREVHMPYTIRYLRQVAERPDIARMERASEEKWQEQMNMLSDYMKGRTS